LSRLGAPDPFGDASIEPIAAAARPQRHESDRRQPSH